MAECDIVWDLFANSTFASDYLAGDTGCQIEELEHMPNPSLLVVDLTDLIDSLEDYRVGSIIAVAKGFKDSSIMVEYAASISGSNDLDRIVYDTYEAVLSDGQNNYEYAVFEKTALEIQRRVRYFLRYAGLKTTDEGNDFIFLGWSLHGSVSYRYLAHFIYWT